MKLKFIGATETVTGSKHLLITTQGKQILLDCGLYQGMGKETTELNQKLGVNPAELEAVILSHAHIDHSGALPLLVKQGFTGKIYCTPGTYDVCEILLQDSAHIQEADIKFTNKRRVRRGLEPLDPLYTISDAQHCLKHFKTIPVHTDFYINDEVSFVFTDAGHITGSAVVNITLHDTDRKIKLTFSGDVGRYTDLLLKDPEPFPQADYIICESTYGNKLHDKGEDAEQKLLNVIIHTCLERKGKLIIPAFSLGRTQEIVFVLDKLKNEKKLPPIPVYVDSPLSVNATEIVRRHPECFNERLHEYIKNDPNPFGFNTLHYIQKAEDSKALNDSNEPCIIISAAGMCDAGRVKHHLRHCISNEKNTVLIVGYCSPRTLGAALLRGDKEVRIFSEMFEVRAHIEALHSYSAHADYKELLRFLSCQNPALIKKLFLVHGEDDGKTAFKEHLEGAGFKNVVIPFKSEIFNL